MQWWNSPERYGSTAKLIHWSTVVLVALAWGLGTVGDDLPGKDVAAVGLFVHISAGLAVVALLILRVLWRTIDPPPAAIVTPLSPWDKWAASITRFALYSLLAATPLVGILVQFARGDALPLFGLGEIASPWMRDRAFAHVVKEVHETLANVLVVLALLHAMAALVHHWLWRDLTLKRMLPRTRS